MMHYFGHVYPCPLGGPCRVIVTSPYPEHFTAAQRELARVQRKMEGEGVVYHIPAVPPLTARVRDTAPASDGALDSVDVDGYRFLPSAQGSIVVDTLSISSFADVGLDYGEVSGP